MDLDASFSGVVAERDFYRRLLDLDAASDIEPLRRYSTRRSP
jgi:hypothetical protein